MLGNKRGQEGVTLTTLLLIILGAVVVVVIILGATGGLNFVFDKVQIAPGQSLEAKTQSCKFAAENDLRSDFCDEFDEVEIGGEDVLVNCLAPEIVRNLDVSPLNCRSRENTDTTFTEGDYEEIGLEYCRVLVRSGNADDDTRVNGVLCSARVECEDTAIGGQLQDRASCTEGDGRAVAEGFVKDQTNRNDICCIDDSLANSFGR